MDRSPVSAESAKSQFLHGVARRAEQIERPTWFFVVDDLPMTQPQHRCPQELRLDAIPHDTTPPGLVDHPDHSSAPHKSRQPVSPAAGTQSHDRHIGRIGAIAGPQRRCVAREQLLAEGLTHDKIEGLIARRFLVVIFPGVYVVGVPTVTHEEFIQASLLHAGHAALATHRTGLELRGLLRPKAGRATVTTTRTNMKSPARTSIRLSDGGFGILTIKRSTPSLPLPRERAGGFATTLLPRTLVDAAAVITEREFGWAWREAEYQCLLDPDAIRAELSAHPRAGSRRVAEQLRARDPLTRPTMELRSRSGELLFLDIVREAGLPTPQTNVPMLAGGNRYFMDFGWEQIGLGVEIDGPQHQRPEQIEADKVRDIDFFIAGIDLLRFTTERMQSHRAWTVSSVRSAYARQLRRATAPPSR